MLDTDQVVPEADPESVNSGDMPYPAVLVMRRPGDSPGQERIELMELNGIDPLSVPTTLRIAATIKENLLGLGERR